MWKLLLPIDVLNFLCISVESNDVNLLSDEVEVQALFTVTINVDNSS